MFYTNISKYGNSLLLSGREDDGSRVRKKIKYQPYLFVDDSHNTKPEFRTVIGKKPVKKRTFESMRVAQDFINAYSDIEGFNWYGSDKWQYVFLNDLFPDESIPYNIKHIKTAYIDIEVDSRDGFATVTQANKSVTAITISDGVSYWVFGLNEFVSNSPTVFYEQYDSEEKMLLAFLAKWREIDPDIVTGWNSNGYDIPYLYNRLKNLFGESTANKLSPFGQVRFKNAVNKFGQDIIKPSISGIACLDYFNLYVKFTQNQQEQYKLGYICEQELGETKVEYNGSLADLYDDDHQKFIEYNIQDVALVVKLEKKKRMLELAVSIAYDSKTNYEDALKSVPLWDTIIHNYLFSKKLVVPRIRHGEKFEAIRGAYVKDPVPGYYRWIISFDASSLYPSLIRQLNISPEKFCGILFNFKDDVSLQSEEWEKAFEYAKENNVTITANGGVYDADEQGFIPFLMEKFYNSRVKFSDEALKLQKELEKNPTRTDAEEIKTKIAQLENIQWARKIMLNSCYGSITNRYFRFYNNDIGESITVSGQMIAKYAAYIVNEWMNKVLNTQDYDYIIASDTDSIMVDCSGLVDSFTNGKDVKREKIIELLDKIAKEKIGAVLEKEFRILAEKTNSIDFCINMNREAICESAIWTGGKRYIMKIWNNKGISYQKPKYKFVGIEIVRSSTPTIVRSLLTDAVKLILEKDQKKLNEYLIEAKVQFMEAPLINIARNSSVSSLEHYRTKTSGAPMQVKGANLYNRLIKQYKLEKKYSLILDGYKIKYLNLFKPNPSGEPVIAFPEGKLPTEFKLEQYVDRDKMFEETFLKPLERIAGAAKLTTSTSVTLDAFFTEE